MRKEITGIYKITNTINNKCYIGKSKTVFRRWYQHKTNLKKGNHHCIYLQNSWNKYGEDSFDFNVIEICEEENLKEREIYWMGYYKSLYKEWGYNLADESKRGVDTDNGERNRKYIKIYQISLENELIKIHDSVIDAAKEINVNHRQLGKKLWGSSAGKENNSYSYKNYCWVKEQDYIEGKEYYPKIFTRNRIGDKRVLFLTKEKVEEFIDMKELAKEKNIDLLKCYSRVRYNAIEEESIIIWKEDYDENKDYFENKKPKYKFINNQTGEIIELVNIKSEAEIYNLNPHKLYCLIKGKKKNKKGQYIDYSNYNGWGLFI